MEVCLPFAGFYYSLWSDEFDNIEEREVEWMIEAREDLPEGIEASDLADLFYRHADYGAMHTAFAPEYVSALSEFLTDKVGFDVPLTFTIMTSPKYYNFETDRIFATTDLDTILALYEWVGEEALRKKAAKMFTSCDGFHSFYSPDIEDWGAVDEWDHNQLLCLFNCLVDEDTGIAIYYALDEVFYTIFQANVNWEKFEYDLTWWGYESSVVIPPPETDTSNYIEKFNELNGLKS